MTELPPGCGRNGSVLCMDVTVASCLLAVPDQSGTGK